jgi:hypothetical protein
MLKKYLTNWKILYAVIIVLLLVVGYKHLEIISERNNSLYLYSYVPHVELIQYQYQSGGEALFHATGFVKFNNIDDQPRDMWQYQTIEPSNKIDESGNRLYLLTDIIKMNYLAPRYFDPVELRQVQSTPTLLTFTDNDGNIFRFNKVSEEVSTQDTSGDSTTLITNQNDYKEFMQTFLK